MSLIVLDASAFAAWTLPSQNTASAEDLLREARRHRFMAPHIFLIEVRSLLLAAERRGRWRIADTDQALQGLEELGVDLVSMTRPAELGRVMGLARSSGLTLYDALYLDLAQTGRAVLATRDKPLLAAALRHGVDLIDLNL